MSDNNEQLFPVTYAITCHQPPIPRADVADGHGACAVLFLAAIGPTADGVADLSFTSINGFTGKQLDPGEQFMIWHQLAKHLAQDLPAGAGRQELCELVVQTIDDAARKAQGDSDGRKST